MSQGPTRLLEFRRKIGHLDPHAHLPLAEMRKDDRILDVKMRTDRHQIAELTSYPPDLRARHQALPATLLLMDPHLDQGHETIQRENRSPVDLLLICSMDGWSKNHQDDLLLRRMQIVHQPRMFHLVPVLDRRLSMGLKVAVDPQLIHKVLPRHKATDPRLLDLQPGDMAGPTRTMKLQPHQARLIPQESIHLGSTKLMLQHLRGLDQILFRRCPYRQTPRQGHEVNHPLVLHQDLHLRPVVHPLGHIWVMEEVAVEVAIIDTLSPQSTIRWLKLARAHRYGDEEVVV